MELLRAKFATHIVYRSPIWAKWAGCRHIQKSVYQAYFLAFQNLANSKPSQGCSNGRCLSGMVIMPSDSGMNQSRYHTA